MRLGKRLFPYPIINNQIHLSSFKNSEFRFDYQLKEENNEFVLDNICYYTNNELLEKLVDEDKVKVVCIVECSATIYRKEFVISRDFQRITIPITMLRDRVVVSAYAYANEDISDYHNFDFIEDYLPYKFNIEKYDILACDDGFTTKINFDDNEDNKVSSIFLVIKDIENDQEEIRINETNDKIVIYLPEHQFNLYDKMKYYDRYQMIFFSILIIPALSHVIQKIQTHDLDEIRLEYNWFSSIESKYKEFYGNDINQDSLMNMSSFEFAQKLMNYPVSKAIDDLFDMATNNPYGDQEDE